MYFWIDRIKNNNLWLCENIPVLSANWECELQCIRKNKIIEFVWVGDFAFCCFFFSLIFLLLLLLLLLNTIIIFCDILIFFSRFYLRSVISSLYFAQKWNTIERITNTNFFYCHYKYKKSINSMINILITPFRE